MKRGKIEAVVFDMDGTLTDSMGYLVDRFLEAMEEVGEAPLPGKEVLARFGPPDYEVLKSLVPPEKYEDAAEAYYRAFERGIDRVRAYEGVPELLEALGARGIGLGLFTGKGRRSTAISLRGVGLGPFFSSVVTGEDVENPKPAPDGILKSMENLGSSPGETLYVGDAPPDLRSARAAGVRVGIALWGDGDREMAGADYYFSEPVEIRRLLT